MHLDFVKSLSKGGDSFMSSSDVVLIDDDDSTALSADEKQVGDRLLEIITQIFTRFPQDVVLIQEASLVVKECCKSGLQFIKPYRLSFFDITCAAFAKCRQACLLTSLTAVYNSIYLKTSDKAAFPLERIIKGTFEVSVVFASNYSLVTAMESHPDVVSEFYDFLSAVLASKKGVLEKFPHEVLHAIFVIAVVEGLQVQEMLAYNSVLRILCLMVDLSQASSEPTVFQDVLQVVCKPVVKQFISSIGGNHSQSILPKICKTLLAIMVAVPTLVHEALSECLQQVSVSILSLTLIL
jgi:hypothetical protein